MSNPDMRPQFGLRNPPIPDDFNDDEAHDASSPGSIIEADVGFATPVAQSASAFDSAQLTRLTTLVRALGWSRELWNVCLPRVLLYVLRAHCSPGAQRVSIRASSTSCARMAEPTIDTRPAVRSLGQPHHLNSAC
jgi:hypothetical protein